MKNQLKNYFKIVFLFIGASVLLWDCEKEEEFIESPQSEISKNPFTLKIVSLEEIPDIKNYLIDKSGDNLFTKSSTIDGAIFDEDNIIEVIDTLSFSNYSFRFIYPDSPVGEFYNLIVGKTVDGEKKEPIVFKYRCDDAHLDDFVANNFDFTFFQGEITIHKYTDFFKVGSILKNGTSCPPEFDQNGDPIPCDKLVVDGSHSGGGGEGKPSTPTGGTSNINLEGLNYGKGLTVTIVISGLKSPRYFKIKDEGKIIDSAVGKSLSLKSGSDICPDCPKDIDGGVGVNSPENIITTPEFKRDYPCQSKTIAKSFLKTAPLSKLILNVFQGAKSEYDLVFDVNIALKESSNQAATQPTSFNSVWTSDKLSVEVGFNPDLLNQGTDLALVATTIHESVHAMLIYALETKKITLDNTNVNEDHILFQLVQKFLRMKIIKNEFGGVKPKDGKRVEKLMHQYMTGLIEDIATSISEFGKSKGYNLPFTYYKKLASNGLEKNIEYYMMLDGELDAKEEAELDAINDALLDEFKNRPNAKGTKCKN